jgi:hypothetical protein
VPWFYAVLLKRVGVRIQLALPGRHPIHLEQIRDDVGHVLRGKRPWIILGHLRADEGEQL